MSKKNRFFENFTQVDPLKKNFSFELCQLNLPSALIKVFTGKLTTNYSGTGMESVSFEQISTQELHFSFAHRISQFYSHTQTHTRAHIHLSFEYHSRYSLSHPLF